MENVRSFVLFCTIVASMAAHVESAKILFLLPISTRSETHFYRPMVDEMARRGHEVTIVTSVPTATVANVTEIIPLTHEEIWGFISNPFEMVETKVDMSLIFFDFAAIGSLCDAIYENAEFRQKIVNGDFEYVVISPLINQCFLGLVHKFKAKLILVSSLPQTNYILNSMGTYNPTSYLPNPCLPFTNQMSFWERTVNFLINVQTHYEYYFKNYPIIEGIYRKHLGQDVPGVREIERTASLLLMNTHFTMNYHRPNLPDVIEVGGLHCEPAKKVPPHLEEFLSEDFIYFSMGTCALGSTIPEEARKKFVNVFSKLKLRVLWKWETEKMDDLPPNVKLSKWIPQQDVLGHPNIKMFITHGGLLSSQEAIYHAVPLIGMPFFFDQGINLKRAVSNGYAIQLDVFNLKEEELEDAINNILTNYSSFKKKAQEISAIYRDQPLTPLERAVYWIERVIRYKGAPHMRSPARDLSFLAYHSLDVVLFLALLLFLSLGLVVILIRSCRRWFAAGPTTQTKPKTN